jgi:hypothetical protein
VPGALCAKVDRIRSFGVGEGKIAQVERALATTERDYDAGDLTGGQYSKREARLTDELAGAKAALEQGRNNRDRIEQSGPVGDAEQELSTSWR